MCCLLSRRGSRHIEPPFVLVIADTIVASSVLLGAHSLMSTDDSAAASKIRGHPYIEATSIEL